ncbi:MAG: PKD domain-containing protein [Solirubrobacteraceae bacterium]
MTAPIRHGALGLLAGVVLLLAGAAAARAAGVADARISTSYVMKGRITTAVRVRGEHRGQLVTRRWTFTGLSCSGSVCQQLSLRRQRSANHYDRLTLSRVGVGSYAGSGRFYSGLRCRGRRYPRGLVVPYRVTVQVAQAVPVEGIAFAGQLTAIYTNLRRIDRTRCPIGPSHDAAQYTGAAAPLPGPPSAAFAVAAQPSTDSATFTDTSGPGAGGARIVARLWQFGDPASGSANSATISPAQHTFSAPGTYQVGLTVTDANGLTATATQTVVAPGPPSAGFTATRLGTSLTYAFQDASQPGVGGTAIVAWLWSFGDAGSSSNVSSSENPQHTFSGPGTYHVCLIVSDANRRSASSCVDLVVPPPGATAVRAQAWKRSVASTALSSPTS